MNYVFLGWVILFCIFVVIELLTIGLVSVWFCLGSAVAAVLELLGCPLVVQIVVFFVVSLLSLFICYPFAKKWRPKQKIINDLVGAEGIVKEEINPVLYTGRVLVKGKDWSVRTDTNEVIPKDSLVVVTGLEGVRLIVKKKEG